MKKILASAAVLSALAGLAAADGIIVSPGQTIAVGINSDGSIFTPNTYNTSVGNLGYVGFQRLFDGYDPINPGTPTEAWSIALDGNVAIADQHFWGSQNLSGQTENYLASSATTGTNVNGGQAHVSQRYSFFAENVIGIEVTVRNTSGGAINSALYNREVDWDISPSQFSEYARADALGGDVVDSSYYGFEDRNPTTPFSLPATANFLHGLGDLGGGMTIDLINLNGGPIAAGGSVSFFVFHSISTDRQSELNLRNQMYSLGASWVITGVSSLGTGPTGFHAAMGYSRNLVPAPGALALLGAAGLVARRRR